MVTRARKLLGRLRARLGGRAAGGVKAENVVWIFGSGRTGSTWLKDMMGDLPDHTVWNEPLVGALFGSLYYERAAHRRGAPFIMGDKYRETWLRLIRAFVLEGAADRFPEVRDGYLVIKEPNGSIGAPLMMEALPESRMICLIRDPRDVAASSMDARRKGSWRYQRRQERGDTRAKDDAARLLEAPDEFVQDRARSYMKNVGNAKQAYEAHQGRKVLVRYEDLRTETLETMKHIYSTLNIPVDEKELVRAVEKHSWENIPEEEKGEGKFYRKATPGGWREDLTPEQVQIVERVAAPFLEEFYPARVVGGRHDEES